MADLNRAERAIKRTSKYRLPNIPTRWHCNHQHVSWKFVQMVTQKNMFIVRYGEGYICIQSEHREKGSFLFK